MSRSSTTARRTKTSPVDVDKPIPYRLTDPASREVTLDTSVREILSLGPREKWTAPEIIGNWYTLLAIAQPIINSALDAHACSAAPIPERGELVAVLLLAHRALAAYDAEMGAM